MCLAIPSKVVEINQSSGVTDTDGVRRVVSLVLVDDVKVGDYVILHAGYAIQKIDEASAAEALQVLRQAMLMPEESS
jgi:hydrogenase expression/formation protein HypC